MTEDGKHTIALVLSLACLCGGTASIAGYGAALIVFGSLLGAAVIYARTRGGNAEPD